MSFITVLLLALSLSADAFAVAVGTGISNKKITTKEATSMAFSFGFFQALMPIIWFYLASLFASIITSYDHWIAFLLLGGIGINMIIEGWNWEDEELGEKKNVFALKSLITLGVATSIDALAVGVSLTAATDNIWYPALMIGMITFVTSYIGLGFGKKFWHHIGSRSEIIGGLILVGIGINILIEHIF